MPCSSRVPKPKTGPSRSICNIERSAKSIKANQVTVKSIHPISHRRQTKIITILRRQFKYSLLVCDNRLECKRALNRHLATHLGERHYVCRVPSCQRSFSRYDNLALSLLFPAPGHLIALPKTPPTRPYIPFLHDFSSAGKQAQRDTVKCTHRPCVSDRTRRFRWASIGQDIQWGVWVADAEGADS